MSLIYNKSIAYIDKFVPPFLRPIWVHPAGPKTIFFWAPAFKWVDASLIGVFFLPTILAMGLVLAGVADITRPADRISPAQTCALLATGLIWSRYSLVIIPKNYPLFSVNVFVASTSLYQLYRAVSYQRSLKQKPNAIAS